jgi:membrane dipeptidase
MINNYSEKTLRLHKQAIVFDAHADTLLRVLDRKIDLGPRNNTICLDIPRLKEGGVKVQVFAIWVDPVKYPKEKGIKRAFDLMKALNQQVEKYWEDLESAPSPREIMDIVKRGKIACLLGLEGGTVINNNLDTLKNVSRKGNSIFDSDLDEKP